MNSTLGKLKVHELNCLTKWEIIVLFWLTLLPQMLEDISWMKLHLLKSFSSILYFWLVFLWQGDNRQLRHCYKNCGLGLTIKRIMMTKRGLGLTIQGIMMTKRGVSLSSSVCNLNKIGVTKTLLTLATHALKKLL